MGFFNSFGGGKQKPKDVAKDRLKFILIHDRGDIPEETLEKIRVEILEVLSKYIEIQKDDVEISVCKEGIEEGANSSSLVANIPIRNIRGQ
ncbi:cell division topological specificity factor MinE [Clostridium chrysemydis]|uniref:cell division topological specificity factor MinE n=1 Tax=Clostridium chrysemydis TaxID=2665504 RepID=UPI001883F07D|nr:cell division topological specificity factor MinE [Clostridium chrysemydis]